MYVDMTLSDSEHRYGLVRILDMTSSDTENVDMAFRTKHGECGHILKATPRTNEQKETPLGVDMASANAPKALAHICVCMCVCVYVYVCVCVCGRMCVCPCV